MSWENQAYAQGQAGLMGMVPNAPKPMPMALVLRKQLSDYQQHCRRIEELLALLEKNPDFEKFINLSRGLI